MYIYKAFVTRVKDGDTFDATVDLGFKISIDCTFRLNNIDTPETWRPSCEAERIHGEKAKQFVKNLIEKKTIILESKKLEIYARYDADVTLSDGSDLSTVLRENGFQKLESYEDKNDTI